MERTVEKSDRNQPLRPAADVRYWLGVVSRAHVERGVAGGFAQLCHGKAAPLRRMRAGDWLIYYSPKTEMRPDAPKLQAFTALGRLVDERVYEVDLGDGWVPHRRDVRYEASPAGRARRAQARAAPGDAPRLDDAAAARTRRARRP
jgi:hypothetical protein